MRLKHVFVKYNFMLEEDRGKMELNDSGRLMLEEFKFLAAGDASKDVFRLIPYCKETTFQ